MFKIFAVLACAIAVIDCSVIHGEYQIPEDERVGHHPPLVDNPYGDEVQVVGGWVTEQGEHPHQLGLFNAIIGGGHLFLCGASLISPKWVITAAHCADAQYAPWIIIRAGDQHLDVKSGFEQEVKGKKFYIHPGWVKENPTGNDFSFDIALLELAEEFNLTEYIQPIPLAPEGEEIAEGTNCIVSGWGSTTQGGFVARNLHAGNVPYVNDEICAAAHPKKVFVESMICAGEKGKDGCQGDSGGPLLCSGTLQKNGTLTGIVSWGDGCGLEGKPGVYTQVSKLRKFINDVTGL